MLIRFYVDNFLSFSKNIEFSMIAGKGTPKFTDQIIENAKIPILRGALLYGANASGKSNFIKSLADAKEMILNLAPQNTILPDKRFRLDNKHIETPTKFEFEIQQSGKIYAYGFTFSPERIEEEWLYIINESTETPIFTRNQKEFKLNDKIITLRDEYSRLKFMYDDLFKNQLYLTAVNTRNITNLKTATDLSNVYNWFDKKLTILFPESRFDGWQIIEKDIAFKEMMKHMLSGFDTGICDINFEPIDINEIRKEIPDKIFSKLETNIPERQQVMFTDAGYENRYILYKQENILKAMELKMTHTTPEGSYSFTIKNESDGTKRLTDLLPLLINLSSNEKVIVIDELDRSLHTAITHKLLDIFLHGSQTKNSQIIVTTHDVGLLDLDLIRKDEIWFVEKDQTGASKLYSLYEFRPRNDLNIQKGYLAGRFGAIPFIGRSVDNFLKEIIE